MFHYRVSSFISCCEISHISEISRGITVVLKYFPSLCVVLTVCWSYDNEWVKRPLASLQFTVCEREVIRVIVTSTMIKLGQCNPHPLHHRQGWKRKKKRWGHHHQTLCMDISMGTQERGLLPLWVGNCVVLGTEGIPRLFCRVPSSPVVCGLQCHVIICPPVFPLYPLCFCQPALSLVSVPPSPPFNFLVFYSLWDSW